MIATWSLEERARAALAEIEDPEMPVSLVDLGLVYGVHADGGRVRVELTFTAMGCPAAELILGDVRERLLAEPDIEEVEIAIVWDPPWTSARISPAGRETLSAWGLGL